MVGTATPLSGNCGNVPPEMLTVMGDPQANLAAACPGGCGSVVANPADAGGCQVVVNFTGCQYSGQTADLSETMTWNASYTMAEGTLTMDAPGVCSGTYAMSIVVQ